MTDLIKIEQFLDFLKSQGRSSPAGRNWAEFYAFLGKHKSENSGQPPMPLILAASGESDATKHARLRNQLEWAAAQGVLSDAVFWLDSLPVQEWNTCLPAQWDKTTYPWD
jgi:hypothetical protein